MGLEEWQEFECPNTNIHFDLGVGGAPMVYEGDTFYCSGCWGMHIATQELIQEYRRDAAGEVRVVPLQKHL